MHVMCCYLKFQLCTSYLLVVSHALVPSTCLRRWQSLVQKLADKANCGSLCLNISPEDASNNFLGYRVSTGEGRYDNNSLSKGCFKKYATDASIYSRQVLLVVTAQVSHLTCIA